MPETSAKTDPASSAGAVTNLQSPLSTNRDAVLEVVEFVNTRLHRSGHLMRNRAAVWLAYRMVNTTKMGLAACLDRSAASISTVLKNAERSRLVNKQFRNRLDGLLDEAMRLNIGGGQ